MTTLRAKDLTLDQVHRLFGLSKQHCDSFSPLLTLDPLTESERQEILQTRNEFENHLTSGETSEGQVKLVAVSPLLRLAGFYRYPLNVTVEEGIARITVTDEDVTMTGRFDILAINRARLNSADKPFWVLVVESKGGAISPTAGLPQLLAYAYRGIQNQEFVWGLATNGEFYRFLYVQPGESPTYSLLPSLNLMDTQSSIQLLQALKAIRQQCIGVQADSAVA